jgi:ion channel POLLUX/CASTOR
VDRPGWRDRARYRFDTFMARGTSALIVGLFAASLVIIASVSLAVWIVGAAREQELGFPTLLWYGLMRTLDPGTMGGDEGSPAFLAGMFAVTLGGIFVISALIGVINTGLQERLAELRKGRSHVVEDGHTVVVGWSAQVFTIIGQLLDAHVGRGRPTIVILADRDKVEMEDAIRERVPAAGRGRIVCRSGSPVEIDDLRIVSVRTARSVIVLSPEIDDPDADVIKTILAITRHRSLRPGGYHIVAEVRERSNLAVAEMVGREAVDLILSEDVTSRIIAQTCRQAGLSAVYSELLDFAGHEMYLVPAAGLAGATVRDALFAFEEAVLLGVAPATGDVILNPPSDRPIDADDRLIVVAADASSVAFSDAHRRSPTIVEEQIVAPADRAADPERTLMLGWNRRATSVLRELDHYTPDGSEVLVVADAADTEASVHALRDTLRHQRVDVLLGDSSSRGVLETLPLGTFDHVVVLCYSDTLDVTRADARTLVTLLHVRDMLERIDRRVTVVSEMLDIRDRALAEVARADDFIVSEHLLSLMIVQVARDRRINAIYRSLLDPEGAEIYLRDAADYVVLGTPVTFDTVIEAARRRGETAFGYRRAAEQDVASAAYGVRLDPSHRAPIGFSQGDRIIVLADG